MNTIKNPIATLFVTLMAMLTILSVLACGDDSESSSFSGSCCLNGSYYTCPTSEDVAACSIDDGPGNCSRDSSQDDECN